MISRYRHRAFPWWVSAVLLVLAGLFMAVAAGLAAQHGHFVTAALYAGSVAGDAWTATYAVRHALRYRSA